MTLGDGGPALPADDAAWLDVLRQLWTEQDPVPPDLADRICAGLATVDLDTELMELVELSVTPAGARGEDRTRTVTFSHEAVSVMVTVDRGSGGSRLDGWIIDGAGLRIELRIELRVGSGPSRETVADQDGRFSFDGVPSGLVRLVVHPTDGAQLRLVRPVSTPGVEV